MQKSSNTAFSSRARALGLATVLAAMTASCDGNDLSLDPLPPIQTTTTTSTTTTLPDTNRYFYEVRSGDTLSAIAAGFGVPMKQIVELNDLENASDIQVGEIIEIPQGFVIVTLPPDSTVASTG
jgi:LysM repeat protein